MKYVLAVKDSEIRDFLMKKLSESGNLTIDYFNEKGFLEESFSKDILLKADLFVKITFDLDYEKKIEFFGEEKILGKIIALNLDNMIEYLSLKKIFFKKYSGLYLIKNLEALCLIINISDEEGEKIDRSKLKEVLYKLII